MRSAQFANYLEIFIIGGRPLNPNWPASVWTRDPEWALDTWRDVNLFVKSREPRRDFLY